MRHLHWLLLPLALGIAMAQPASNPALLTGRWPARWITAPKAAPFDFGVYHFRRTFELAAKPERFVVHTSGDNRYELFVNGQRVATGPARGDLYHWRYETIDLAPWLNAGRNVLAAVVWNFGQYAPEAQITWQTGFLLQGDTEPERIADSGPAWKVLRDAAYEPIPYTSADLRGYYAAGPGERVTAARYPWGWQTPGFDDSAWQPAQAISNGSPRDSSDGPNRWMLVPRTIPPMEERPERIVKLRKADGATPPEGFPGQAVRWTVPAHTRVRLLLDQTHLTTAYPELTVSGGKGAQISLGYAEALILPGRGLNKGNRNEIEGKQFIGYRDVFVADGGAARLYRPLWWRTWRYLEMTVETEDQPLSIDDLRGVFSGYPFERKARFDGGSPEFDRILDTGWRTARLCAHESYMDCPYYEQLQYVGDTRIQALVSMYMTGDARLVRNAISQLNDSRTPEGATYSRAPSRLQQYIPPFSLWWIGMVHDYWMYQNEPAFVRDMLPGVRSVLQFYAKYQKPGGSLGRVPWWNFVDWVSSWPSGVPPAEADGSTAPIDLQLLLAYDWAADLEDALGNKALAADNRRAAGELRGSIRSLYWDSAKQLFADTPKKATYSQHANVLAILAGVVQGAEASALMHRVLDDRSLTPTSIYFRHYLFSALNKVGEGDRYLDLLGDWRQMLSIGLSTWAEKGDPTRSDCHAWTASPNYELFHTVLGIDSAAPGFRRVLIRPFPGKLARVSGAIPHPQGEIRVSLEQQGGKWNIQVQLPAGISGDLDWHGKRQALQPGENRLLL
jgi:alpha-L-rhamnosidase